MQVKSEGKESLWNRRFGHLHYGGLKKLENEGMVHGILSMDYTGSFCE